MNRLYSLILSLLAVSAVPAFADGPHVIEAPPRVMVFPFAAVGDTGAYQWIGAGIQQSLLVEVNRPGTIAFTVSNPAPSTQPAIANADPLAEAARNDATIAVYGSFQIVNDDVRITGQAVETGTAHVLASLTATGSIHDLFKLEDELSSQLHSALPQPQGWSANATPAVVQQPTPAVVEYGTMNVTGPGYVPAPTYVYNYPQTYGIPYPTYSSYGYGPGCTPFTSGFIFYGTHEGGFRDDGFRGFQRRAFDGPRSFFVGAPVTGIYSGNGGRGDFNRGGSFHGGFGIGFHSGSFNGGFRSGGFEGRSGFGGTLMGGRR